MSLREEQCKKVCRILDDVLANRPTERDSLIVAVRKAFKALTEPSQVAKDIARIVENGQDMRVIAQGRIRGRWIIRETSSGDTEARCSHCGFTTLVDEPGNGLHMVSDLNFCSNCGAKMEVTT